MPVKAGDARLSSSLSQPIEFKQPGLWQFVVDRWSVKKNKSKAGF